MRLPEGVMINLRNGVKKRRSDRWRFAGLAPVSTRSFAASAETDDVHKAPVCGMEATMAAT